MVVTAAAVVLIGSTVPLWRVVVRPEFRRVAPRRVALVAAVATTGLGVALSPLAGAAGWPVVSLASVMVLLCAVGWWRARPSYGRRCGLPPGRLALAPIGPLIDDLHHRRLADGLGPVFKTGAPFPRLGVRPMVCVVDNHLAAEVLRRHDGALVPTVQPMSRLVPGGVLRSMHGTDHAAWQRVLRHGFGADVVARATSSASVAASIWCDEVRADPSAHREVAPGPLARRIVGEALWPALVGFDAGSAAGVELAGLLARIRVTELSVLSRRRRLGPVIDRSVDHLLARLDDGSAAGPSVLHGVVAAATTAEPLLDVRTAVGNVVFALTGNLHDLEGLFVWTAWYLAHHPEWADALATADDAGPGSLADRFVLETLRLDRSEYVMRRTVAPIEIGGHRIPSGWMLRACVREAHRDPAMFPDPDRFDPDRFLGGGPPAPAYAPFGLFRHHCLGAALSRAVVATAVLEMAKWMEVAPADPEAGRVHGRFHWEPDARFALRCEPRSI
jgi:cytochrome P450